MELLKVRKIFKFSCICLKLFSGKAFYSNNIQLDANARRRVPPSSAYDVMITVVNPNPEELTADLDIKSAANGEKKKYIWYAYFNWIMQLICCRLHRTFSQWIKLFS